MPRSNRTTRSNPGAATAASGASETDGKAGRFAETGNPELTGHRSVSDWAVERLESLDGLWLVEWNHDHAGYLTYAVTDREEEQRYVARYDDGWRIAPKGHTTVDFEALIDEADPELMTLVETLNAASGRNPVPGIHTWKETS